MNICMVTHDFPPQIGGIAVHVFELTRYLVKFNQKVFILTPEPKDHIIEFLDKDGIQVFYIKENFGNMAKSILLPLKLIDYSIRARSKLRKIIKKYSIDLVHYHNLVPESLITKGLKIPVVFTAHESHLVKSDLKNKNRLYCYLSHVDHLIAASQDRLGIARKYCPQVKSVQYLSNGVDTERFTIIKQTNEIRKKYQISPKAKTILIVSRLEEVKGVIYFIEAIPKILNSMKDINVMIIGDGSQRPFIQQRIHELKIDEYVVWKGSVENKYMPDYYGLADLVVIPSLEEATSITGLEAMASGKPLIGTKVGGIPALIDDEKNGFLVPPKEPQKLADAVVAMFEKRDRMIEMGKYSRNKAVKEFSWDKIAKETLKIYERCYSN